MHQTIRILIISLTIALLSFSTAPVARAAEDESIGWVKLGESDASRNADQDEFDVNQPDTTYSKIRFRNHGPAVHFIHIQVTFGDGDKEEIDMDKTVLNDQGTGPLPLHGKHRTIKRVVVAYQTVGHHRGGDGIVSLWGLK